MSVSEQDLDRLLRGTAPAMSAERALTLREQATLEGILSGRSSTKAVTTAATGDASTSAARPRSKRTRVMAWALSAAVVVIAVVCTPFLLPTRAVAVGPAPLTYTAVALSAEDVFAQARSQLGRETGGTSERAAETSSWNLTIAEDGTPERTAVIAPTVTRVEWTTELSGHKEVLAGAAYFADGDEGNVPIEDAAPAGTPLGESVFAVGEFPASVRDADVLDAAGFATILGAAAPRGPTAGDAFLRVGEIMAEWRLSGPQEAELLAAVAELPGATVLGETVDRRGRPALGVQAPTSLDGRSATLLISQSTGRTLGIEVTENDSPNRLEVPPGTVVSYTLWKEQQ